MVAGSVPLMYLLYPGRSEGRNHPGSSAGITGPDISCSFISFWSISGGTFFRKDMMGWSELTNLSCPGHILTQTSISSHSMNVHIKNWLMTNCVGPSEPEASCDQADLWKINLLPHELGVHLSPFLPWFSSSKKQLHVILLLLRA